MPDFFDDRRPHEGFTYDEYRAYWKNQKEESPTEEDASARRLHHYLNYNWERQAHVHEAYDPSEQLQSAIDDIDESQLWMVITEPWCGDSAFLLPVIAEAASVSDEVTLRILLRDDNLDVMDQYLTGGSRSIPKLVAFSEDGEERFTWGPRPDGAAELFETLRDEYDDKKAAISDLIEYYEDGGWRETEDELTDTIETTVGSGAEALET